MFNVVINFGDVDHTPITVTISTIICSFYFISNFLLYSQIYLAYLGLQCMCTHSCVLTSAVNKPTCYAMYVMPKMACR